MKRMLVCLVILCVLGMSGCSLFGGGPGIQPGRPKSDRPGSTKPPAENKCIYTVTQKTTLYPEIYDLVPTEIYSYEYEVANQNKAGTLDFKCTMGEHIKSITPSTFKVGFGAKQLIKVDFLIPAGTNPGTMVKFLFTVTPNCNVLAQDVSFTLKSVQAFTYKFVYPPPAEIRKEPVPSVLYSYEMVNHMKDKTKNYIIELTSLSGPKVGFIDNSIVINAGQSKKFYATFFLTPEMKVGDKVEYKFKIILGYWNSNQQFVQVGTEKIESYTLLVVQ